ncbi:MAG: hypothetical protein IJU92_07405 [Spirochaetaceae bacterium]|nr:hypothetical protein [Spirochaetaceae bacterium]
MKQSTIDVIDRGLKCLSDNLGASEAEIFITTLLSEHFDYTKWRKTFVDSITSFEQLDELTKKSQVEYPFSGNAQVVM